MSGNTQLGVQSGVGTVYYNTDTDGSRQQPGGWRGIRDLVNGGDNDLSDLNTVNKTNIVAAINELLATGGGGGGGSGTNGKSVLNGTTAPANSVGTAGDFYINTATWTIYGPKTATWPAGVSLVGTKGDAGAAGADASTIATVVTKSASYALAASDSSMIHRVDAAGAITVSLPNNLPVGFQIAVVQSGTGVITFAANSGAVLASRLGYTKTAGQYSVVSLIVTLNADGNSARYILTGDGA